METIIEKYGKHRVFLICYCLFAFLLIAEAVILFNIYNTVNYKGHKLRVQEAGSNRIVMHDRDKNVLIMKVETQINVNYPQKRTISYLAETITYEYKFGEDSVYTFSDGSTYTEPFIQVSYSSQSPDELLSSVQTEEKQLVNKLSDYFYDYKSTGVFIGFTIFGLLLLLLAHRTFFYPEGFWRLETFLSVRGGEPTDLYIFMSKLSSVVIIVMVYIGLIVIL